MQDQEKLFSQSLQLHRRGQNQGQSFPTYEHQLFQTLAPFFGQGFLSALADQNLDKGPTTKTTAAWAAQLGQCQICPRECVVADGKVVHQMGKWKTPPPAGKVVLFLLDGVKEKDADERNPLGGEAGELLLKMVAAMKLPKDQFAISLLAKCAPASPEHLPRLQQHCRSHWELELDYLRPSVVVAMGAQAVQAMLGEGVRLGEAHGQFFARKHGDIAYQVVPVFHPEYLIANPGMKRAAWSDLQKIMKKVEVDLE